MRIKSIFLTVTAILFLSAFIFRPTGLNISNKTSYANNISDKFLFGAMDSHYDYFNNPSFAKLDSLGFNVNSMYTSSQKINGRDYPTGLDASDNIFNEIGRYKELVTTQLGAATSLNGMRNLLCRPKTEWLLHGQRSDYQCENVNLVDTNYWFYSFQNPDSIGRSIQDSNKWVRYCNQGVDNAGWVVSRLRANTEQCNPSAEGTGWRGDSQCEWLVKPRIRIPASFPTANPDAPVCRIEVIKEDGTTKALNEIIKAKHFLNSSGQYSGEYTEEFTNLENPDFLKFKGALGTNGFFNARCNDTVDGNYSKADIKIYWYGNCDMWIDYVRVDNDIADELFKGLWDTKIKDEVHQIAFHQVSNVPIGLKFYVEYLNFNQLPCAKYVNKILKESSIGSDTIDLMADLDWTFSQHVNLKEVQRVNNAEYILRNYIQRVGFRQIFCESYPLTTSYGSTHGYDYSKIPNTLPKTIGDGILAVSDNPSDYDIWLQDNLDRQPFILEQGGGWTDRQGEFPQLPGYNRYWLSLCNNVSKIGNIPFIHMPQAHLWHWSGERRREPTNEELDMLANVAISYGVKGFIYFWFPSHGRISNERSEIYGVGMTDPWDGSLRTKNVYGQTSRKKWEVIRDIGRRAKAWESYLLNFNNNKINSYYYANADDKSLLNNNSFINLINSYSPLQANFNEPDLNNPELQTNTYVQIATFENSAEQYNKYFMVVNRRCSPVTEGNYGGKRQIQIKFNVNSQAFNGNNNWKIMDLETGNSIITFNKSQLSLINLGWFMPGEGKLYKIEPVQ